MRVPDSVGQLSERIRFHEIRWDIADFDGTRLATGSNGAGAGTRLMPAFLHAPVCGVDHPIPEGGFSGIPGNGLRGNDFSKYIMVR